MGREKTPVRIIFGVLVFAGLAGVVSCASLNKVTGIESKAQDANYFEAKRSTWSGKTLLAGTVSGIFGVNSLERVNQNGKPTTSTIVLGERILEKDILRTERSRLHARFTDATEVFLGEESIFSIERMRFGKANPYRVEADEVVFHFVQGLARFAVNQMLPNERFIVKAPSAMIKTTGPTEFYLIQIKGVRDLTIKVVRGSVQAFNIVTGEHATVGERTGVIVRSTGTISAQGPFSDNLLNFLKSRTEI